jgi:hypothetical protein
LWVVNSFAKAGIFGEILGNFALFCALFGRNEAVLGVSSAGKLACAKFVRRA